MKLDLQEFKRLCSQSVSQSDYRLADEIVDQIVVYDARGLLACEDSQGELPGEFVRCLKDGPGVLLIRHAYEDTPVIDEMTELYRSIVSTERVTGESRGDHFGNNERIWNSLQKSCVNNPILFVKYYSNRWLHRVSRSWLGPNYRVTSQVNNVKPGGEAQAAHRDYHLGFQTSDSVRAFPIHAQVMSQYLTLQGAVAHTDMPREKGPTWLLPFSQQYPTGYVAYHEREFRDYFKEHAIQLPLAKGDLLFFNPAVFHAGGANTTESDRIANLFQVSSAFGQTMESLCHRSMIRAVYPVLQAMMIDADANQQQLIANVLATVADGYSFPTNLDRDPPVDANPPSSQRDIVQAALREAWPLRQVETQLDLYEQRRRP